MTAADASARASRSRRKGVTFEQVLARYLRQWWPNAVRAVRTGSSAAADPGDVDGIPGLIVSAKDCRTEAWPAWWAELDAMLAADPAALGVIVLKRKGHADPGAAWVHMRLDDLTAIVEGRRYMPTSTCRITVDDLVGLLRAAGYMQVPA